MKKLMCSCTLFSLIIISNIGAQTGDRLTSLAPENAELYAKPLATFMGSYFNSGGYYDAKVPAKFSFKIRLVAMLVSIPDNQTTFNPVLPDGYDNSEPTATFFGNKGTAYLGPGGFITFPPGINETSVPAGIPQIAASMFATEVMLRYFPKLNIDDTEVSLLGWGIKHSISHWFPTLPVDIAVQILFNRFKVSYTGDNDRNFFDGETKNWAFNAHASKSFGLLGVYGGFQYESTTLDLEYNWRVDPEDPSLDVESNVSIDGDNKTRLTVGGTLNFGVLIINADYNFTSQNILSGGLTLVF